MSKKLPVVGSTAATTKFDSARIDGPEGTYLFIDGNGKITRDNGTLLEPRPNAFSLVQVETCPGSTEACRSACYVHNLETHQGAIHDLYKHNTREIRRILNGFLAEEWIGIMAGWIRENAAGGFRWHVSGDVFSDTYAWWIHDVCRAAPEVPFWIYTRSFGDSYLCPLAEVSTVRGGNLSLNLSCDRDNYARAREAAIAWSGWDADDPGGAHSIVPLRLCYLTLDGTVPDDLPEGSVIFPDYNLRPRQFATLAESPWWQTLTPAQRAMVCPVDAHGKSEKNRCGPCTRCLT